MPRYAAIDIGSNSVRMLVSEVTPGIPARAIAAERQVTRLGASVFRNGRISVEAMTAVSELLARMAQTYQKLDVLGVRAVATSAVRDASNQHEFLARASQAVGVAVEIISGQEEARLIHLGVQSRWPHPKQRILVIDVGGGSAEFILSESGAMTAAFSKPLGAVRLTEVFLRHDPPEPIEIHRMEEFIQEKLATPARRLAAHPFDRAVATSASAAAIISAVNRLPRTRRDSADRLRATSSQIRRMYRHLATSSVAERRKTPGIGPRRSEIIVAGAGVFVRAMEDFRLPSLYYSAAGLRDGVIADLAEKGVGRERARLDRDQRRVVEDMAQRYGVPIRHARKVAVFARVIFDSLHDVHQLPLDHGKILEAASYLHDCGHYISDTSHHKHSAYIVANSDLPGFTHEQRMLIAMLCRYHRKSMPSARHDGFQALDGDRRRTLLVLTPMLRLADSLDRSHDQRIDSIECQVRDGGILISLASELDTDLEQWAAERAAVQFQEVFGRALSVNKVRR